MTDLSREILHQRISDAVALAAVPANAAIWWWFDKIDLLLRVGIGVGSFILVWFAVWAKIKQWVKS
jgi:hypothetical protein